MESQPQNRDKKLLNEVREAMRLHHDSIHTAPVATTMNQTHTIPQGGHGAPNPPDYLRV